MIHSELLDIFYSYMQTLNHKNINLTYIILTEQVSFIPDNILNRSITIPVKRPTKNSYSKCIGKTLSKSIKLTKINNIKILKTQTYEIMNSRKNYANQFIDIIENYQDKQFIDIRNTIYNFFIYGIDISESLWMVINHFIKKKKLDKENKNVNQLSNEEKQKLGFKYVDDRHHGGGYSGHDDQPDLCDVLSEEIKQTLLDQEEN